MTIPASQHDPLGPTPQCPDDETVAAYLDHRLSDADIDRIEAHMADCDRCVAHLAILAEVSDDIVEAQGAREEGRADKVVSFPPPATPVAPSPVPVRLRRWLAPVAAVLVVGVSAALTWQLVRDAGPGIPELQEAARVAAAESAADSSRSTFGRLSGFPYGAPPAVRRSGTRTTSGEAALPVMEAARQVEAARAGRDDVASLHAYGVALLLAGDVDAAVDRLSRAAVAAPGDARVLNDAATAHLQKAQLTSDAPALAEARRLADAAVQREPALAEGWFNLAQVAVLSGDEALRQRAIERLGALRDTTEWRRELEAP